MIPRLSRGVAAAVFALLALTASQTSAQVGSTTDILTGTVTNTAGAPIPGATVEAKSFDTQVTRRARTNAEGRYTILFPDGGGQYQLTVKFLGMAPATLNVSHVADEDRLVTNVRLSQNPTEIQGVVVRARQTPRDAGDRPTPGSQERNLTPEQLARLPIDQSDLALLATLAPGVVGIEATDSTASAFSVAGLRPDANSVTLDGLTFGASTIPQDAVRNTRVITSSYDVARGQFSGGQIASTTRSGSNFVQGTFNYSLRDQDLAWEAGSPTAFNSGYTQNQLSGGFGGPIVKDKLFVFGSAQARRRTDAVPSLVNADAATLGRVGVSRDSVDRFLSIVQGYGLTPDASLEDSRDADNYSALVRVDLLASAGQTLTLRGDFRGTGQDPTRVGALSLPQTGGNQRSSGGGIMAVLSSNFGGRFINELRAYAQTDQRHSDPFFLVPAARVQVNSDLTDARSITTLAFGGNAGLPQRSLTKRLDLSNELSWLEGNGAHRIKLGVLFSGSRFSQDGTSNRLGTFTFNSLEDLANNEPSIFTRTLLPSIRTGTSLNSALYLGDTWRKSRSLQLTYGARLEHTQFDGAPAYNPEVEEIFGYRTNEIPTETHASPRAGFTWVVGGSGAGGAFGGGGFGGFGRGGRGGGGAGGGNNARPNANASASVPLVIRGGIGEFRSVIPTSLYSGAQNATGLSQSESQLYCIGSFVPTPDWSTWSGDDADIPTTCSGGTVNTPPVTARPNVTVFDRNFAAPRAWRASLGAQRRVFDRMQLSVDANFARGVSQYGFHDLNLDTTPKFSLGAEGGRPVFANPSDIVPATGAVSIISSRLAPQFGQVIAVGSDLKSESEQLVIAAQGITRVGAIFNISYTLARAKDQSSASGGSATGGFSAATTAGDPNVREWAPSSFDRRHSFVGTVTYPFNEGLEMTAIGRLSSGAPFTPMVASDINADGARNDRAFIFDPRTTADTSVANAMRRLLGGSSRASDCLESQIGTVAGRNSCTGPWQPSLDFQVNYRPFAFGLDRRLMLSLTTVNFLGGLDQLINGQKNLQGWGTSRLGDPTLLYVRGFDPVTERYQYQVNERFGAQRSGQGSIVLPFQIGFQARYTIGPDRTRDAVRGALAQRAAGRLGGAGGAGNFASRFERILPNPITQILARKDSIALTDSQVVRLTVIRDSLDARNKLVSDAVKSVVDKAGANPDPGALFGALRPKLEEGRANAQKAVGEAKGILTAEQWAKLPERIRNPGQQRAR
ncbi:MAG TPA: carboxypeptidase regulatory-like domain-containing protein [Gemmatimonadaceae bacterium]|nr:carboxypeptidase regulatory-like domain-containing protein [Gemmatimonadaceae bacterium]